MRNDHEQFEALEQALGRLAAAEKAGVFGATPVDAAAILRAADSEAPVPMIFRLRRVLPFAAAAMVAMGVWGAMWSAQLSKMRRDKATLVSGIEHDCDGSFLKCFQGPLRADVICRNYDYDRDGDIDLADFGAYQMDCDGPVAMR